MRGVSPSVHLDVTATTDNGHMAATTADPPVPASGAVDHVSMFAGRLRERRRAFALSVALATAAYVPVGDLAAQGRAVLAIFGVCVVLWAATEIADVHVAIGGAIAAVSVGAIGLGDLAGATVDPTTWLLLASFVLAAGAKTSGLAHRATVAVAGRARSVSGLFALLTVALGLTSFVIPATSGRAALALPVFVALADALDDRRLTRALALLFPTTILLSAVASLLGAGAHLVTAQALARTTGEELGFTRWAMLGVPFAAASCALATFTIGRLFLTAEERRRPLRLDLAGAGSSTGAATGRDRRIVAVAVAAAVAGWATTPVHGVDPAVVAVVAAGALIASGVVGPRQAVRSVSWPLLLFLAATLVLGQALIDTGAARWLVGGALGLAGEGTAPEAVIAVVALVSLLAHLVITSRTARSSALIPLVLLVAVSTSLDPVALAFVSTAAAGYCLTLPASAKPVALFSDLDRPTYSPADLRRLSRVLLPAHLVLLVAFALAVWPALGLSTDADESGRDARRTPLAGDEAAPSAERPFPTAGRPGDRGRSDTSPTVPEDGEGRAGAPSGRAPQTAAEATDPRSRRHQAMTTTRKARSMTGQRMPHPPRRIADRSSANPRRDIP